LIESSNKIKNVFREKEILIKLKHRHVVKLYRTFQDAANFYFMLEYVPKGTLSRLINKLEKLPLELARFYAA